MIHFEIPKESLEVLERFTTALRDMPEVAEGALSDVLTTIKNLVQEETPVGETGDLKSGWSSISQVAGGYSFENRTPYAYVIEEGKFRGVGPRTVRTGDGIFSRQAPKGMTGPVLSDDAAINRSILFVLERITRALEG